MFSVILFVGILCSVHAQYGGYPYGGGGDSYPQGQSGCCTSYPSSQQACCPDPCCIPDITPVPCCPSGGYGYGGKPHHRRIKGSKIQASIKLPDEDFAAALEDKESMGFKELATKLSNALSALFEGDYSFKGVKIIKFSEGSVVANFVIKLATGYKYENEIINSARNKLEDAVATGKIGPFNVDKDSLEFIGIERGVYIYPYHYHNYYKPKPYYHYYLKKFTTATPTTPPISTPTGTGAPSPTIG